MLFKNNEDGSLTIMPEEKDIGGRMWFEATILKQDFSDSPVLALQRVELAKKRDETSVNSQLYECASQGCGCGCDQCELCARGPIPEKAQCNMRVRKYDPEPQRATVEVPPPMPPLDWAVCQQMFKTFDATFPAYAKLREAAVKSASDVEGTSGVSKRRDDVFKDIFG